MAGIIKNHLGREIKSPHMGLEIKLPHLSLDIKSADPTMSESGMESPKEQILFFGSRYQRKENTWVILLFVVLHLVVFVATMFINDCPQNSRGDCSLKSLGRFSFQSLAENPLLGPSSSTLDEMGALQRSSVIQHHQLWRLATWIWLHAGVIHLILNLSSVIFIGIRLEQQFGPLRIGIIYLLSAFLGSLASTLFVQYSAAVGSSGALFGLLGAMLSGLIQNWGIYADKVAASTMLFVLAIINLVLGLLPHVDNFSNIGGFLSGILLGFVLLYNPLLCRVEQKKGLFDYDVRSSMRLKDKLDKPAMRIASLVLFGLVLSGGVVAVLRGVNANECCSWCHYINCAPTKWWNCNEKATQCEVMVSVGRLTLTCEENGHFRIYPYADISEARVRDLCSQICS
ncbi:RHOMBOID-like protein 8 [Magnolia sinica]|uniref:RHOMBOID-like protein 8 n=1 Tax=Magnolia sinica TaxID=86752 RepID=UPI00265B2E96|nr:RHOMBOID-like protein 8 [Magnolia sinica]